MDLYINNINFVICRRLTFNWAITFLHIFINHFKSLLKIFKRVIILRSMHLVILWNFGKSICVCVVKNYYHQDLVAFDETWKKEYITFKKRRTLNRLVRFDRVVRCICRNAKYVKSVMKLLYKRTHIQTTTDKKK